MSAPETLTAYPVRGGVCLGCGSAVLRGEHLRDDAEPCLGRPTPPPDGWSYAVTDLGMAVTSDGPDADELARHGFVRYERTPDGMVTTFHPARAGEQS